MIQVPNTMKCVFQEAKDQKPYIKDIPIPQPLSGQVLVKMDSAPLNHQDLLFSQGLYPSQRTFPCVLGFEGSGNVVLSGGGLFGWGLIGKRVAVFTVSQFGTFAEFAIVDATMCIEIEQDVSLQQASCYFVNPMTVMAMLDDVKSQKVKAVVHSAAASQLGRMMVRHFQANGIRVINIVRRDEQIEILKKEGALVVLNQNDPDFQQKLKDLSSSLEYNCFLYKLIKGYDIL